MVWPLGMILFGLLFIYAGVKGLSVSSLLLGNNTTPSSKPAPVQRGAAITPTPSTNTNVSTTKVVTHVTVKGP